MLRVWEVGLQIHGLSDTTLGVLAPSAHREGSLPKATGWKETQASSFSSSLFPGCSLMPLSVWGQVSLESLRVRGREEGENIRNRAGFVFVLFVCRYWGFWEGGSKGGRQTHLQHCWAFSFSGLCFTLRVLTCPWLAYSGKESHWQLQACWLANLMALFLIAISWCRMTAIRAWWPSWFVSIFLLCKRGRKSWLPLRDMNTAKQKSAQNPGSHRACPRQEVGPHCERVSYSKLSAD